MAKDGRMTLVKIFRAPEWAEFRESGRFAGSADDLRDGFIHLSDAEQVEGTLERHFAGEAGLVLAQVDVVEDPSLRWELSRGGAMFPHLYRPLLWADVAGHEERA